MTKDRPKDVAASVRARLQNRARETNRPFAELFQYFAMERFLYRLSRSPHADKLVLKGALMLVAWQAPTIRPTKDIDLLAKIPNDVDSVTSIIREICEQPVEADGIRFDATSVHGRVIKEDADYEGVRVTFVGYVQRSRASMQIDIGFGDVVVPGPEMKEYPTILDFAAPRLLSYSPETTIAEKFEAMVHLGALNSRMKDFFDIWLLSHQFNFDGRLLSDAVRRTFANRGTQLTANPVAWTTAFSEDANKQAQWEGFLRKSRLNAPATLGEVTQNIAQFLGPVAEAIESKRSFERNWASPGPWA